MPTSPSMICQMFVESGYSNTTSEISLTSATNSNQANLGKHLAMITYAYIAPVIITIGMIGDVLTVYTLTHPLLRRTSIVYTYLTLLAMTDLLTQLSVIPMILWLLEIRQCSAASAFYYAHVGFPLANALMGASVWIVVFLTLSQYMAVCRPFTYGMRSRKVCFVLFAVAYAFNFIIYAPWAMKKRVHKMPHDMLTIDSCPYVVCDEPPTAIFKMYEIPRELISRVLPFFMIATMNARILITYRDTKQERTRRLTANSQKHYVNEKSEREEKRLFMLLFTICIIFFVCTIPAAPFTVLVNDSLANNVPFQIFRALTNLLEFTKFALNFYFYCLINPEIRRICVHVITCKELHRPARVKGQPMTPISMYTRWAESAEEREKLRYTKSRDFLNESRRGSGNTEFSSRRNSSLRGSSAKHSLKETNGLLRDGEPVRHKTSTIVQADVLYEKLTVIRENEDMDEVGERL